MKPLVSVVSSAALACLLSLPLIAAERPASPSAPSEKTAVKSQWPAERLSGTIMQVRPGMKLLIMKDSDGVPFDIAVTPATRIEMNNQRVPLDQLKPDAKDNVSVHFIPERRGDVAESIRVSS